MKYASLEVLFSDTFLESPRWVHIYSVDFWSHDKIQHCLFIPFVINSFLSQFYHYTSHSPMYHSTQMSHSLFCPVSENEHLKDGDLLLNTSFCYSSSTEVFLHWLPKTSTGPVTKIFFSPDFPGSISPLYPTNYLGFLETFKKLLLAILLLPTSLFFFSFSFSAQPPNISIHTGQQLKRKRQFCMCWCR